MNVNVNEQKLELPEDSSVEQLLLLIDSPLKGSAVAVNQQIINRSQWSEYKLNSGDKISLFQAIAGG